MSYTRHYERYVPYSGWAEADFKKEDGGTEKKDIWVRADVPVSVDVFVDTDPFDSSVNGCSHSVQNLNGAVVAMNSAQVASIAKSANDISSHVITGFFNAVKSELDQNLAALSAKFKSVFELISSKSSDLEKQQIVMQDDYSRISERYSKIFQNLDEELEKRVIALDKNVVEISKRIQGQQLNSETSKKVAQFLLGVNEDEIIKQQLIVANAKAKTQKAIDSLAENVIQESFYSKKVQSILNKKNCSESESNYIPVIFTESSNLESEVMDYDCFSNPLNNDSKSAISESVKNYFVSNSAQNQEKNESESRQIDEAFNLIAEKEFQDLTDEKSKRVYEMLKKLKGGTTK